jgi:hypothetical protein
MRLITNIEMPDAKEAAYLTSSESMAESIKKQRSA